MILGDLNCDILRPDKGPREGRALMDLMIEYNLTNLIREPTRVTATSSKSHRRNPDTQASIFFNVWHVRFGLK